MTPEERDRLADLIAEKVAKRILKELNLEKKKYISLGKAMDMLGVTRNTIIKYIKDGDIIARKPRNGKNWIVLRESVDQIINIDDHDWDESA